MLTFALSTFLLLQQLNFYSFRKIKVTDSLRIDPELEKETANYWRFKHESFQRGRPDLLREIKRMNSKPSTTAPLAATTRPKTTAEDKQVKSEVSALKKRIEEMTKNIDELTSLVQQVSLKQEESEGTTVVDVGSKRPRVSVYDVHPDEMLSTSNMMALEELVLSDPTVSVKEEQQDNGEDFVDSLFTAFKEEEEAGLNLEMPPLQDLEPEPIGNGFSTNRPDPVLMQRLSEALSLLPRETQELIVNRLIKAITEPVLVSSPAVASMPVVSEGKAAHKTPSADEKVESQPPSLAAATLGALLQQCGAEMQRKSSSSSAHKNIPVHIPVHG